jgi:hypothetical protein
MVHFALFGLRAHLALQPNNIDPRPCGQYRCDVRTNHKAHGQITS